MNALGTGLIILGVIFLGVAGINARNAPNISYLIGSYMPGLLCLIIGLALRLKKQDRQSRDREDDA